LIAFTSEKNISLVFIGRSRKVHRGGPRTGWLEAPPEAGVKGWVYLKVEDEERGEILHCVQNDSPGGGVEDDAGTAGEAGVDRDRLTRLPSRDGSSGQ